MTHRFADVLAAVILATSELWTLCAAAGWAGCSELLEKRQNLNKNIGGINLYTRSRRHIQTHLQTEYHPNQYGRRTSSFATTARSTATGAKAPKAIGSSSDCTHVQKAQSCG